jgi:bifunctional NMN adenylyltransferase/nudix hydrolase
MKKYDYAVLIGRFQPFHSGHQALFDHAFKISKHVIIVAGSHRVPRSIRNPWNSGEREVLIRAALSECPSEAFSIVHIHDSAYNFNDWLVRVQHEVHRIAGEASVVIVGHYKDDTSYYLNYFPGWSLDALPEQAGGISSTKIRDACFEGRFEEVKCHCASGVYDAILHWTKEDTYKTLCEEYSFIREYKKKWENAPYPPTFVTADAVVFALGHVLLVKRKLNPGKGRLALPGGFVNQNESIENACIRELGEETALDVGHNLLRGSIKMNHVFDHPLRDPRGRLITHAFMFELNVKTLPSILAGDDAADVFWYPLHKIEDSGELFFNDHAHIIRFFMNRMK